MRIATVLPLLILSLSFSFTSENMVYYCIQIASSGIAETLKGTADHISSYPSVRVEKIGNFYALRVGYFDNRVRAEGLQRELKRFFPDAFVRRCTYKPERTVYSPRPKETKGTKEKPLAAKLTPKEPEQSEVTTHLPLYKTDPEIEIWLKDKRKIATLLIALLPLLFLTPLLPALLEYVRKRDAKPIDINLMFSKDPAYFGKSFLNLLIRGLKDFGFNNLSEVPSGAFKLPLSKGEEWVIFCDSRTVEAYQEVNIPMVLIGSISLREPTLFKREVIVLGDLTVKAPCVFRALYVTGNCYILEKTSIVRWLHVGKNLHVKAITNLGHNAYVELKAQLNDKTMFRRLFAEEVNSTERPLIDKAVVTRGNPIIVKGTLRTRSKVTIGGKERPVVFEGDIFSDEDIELSGDVWVKGSVFSQQSVKIENGVVVGEKEKVKSIVAKKGLDLKGDFKVYGYLHTEGEGKVSV